MRMRYALTAITAFTLIGVALAAHQYRHAGTLASAHTENELRIGRVMSQEQGVGPIRNLRFTLFDGGIRPSTMRVKSGLVNIHIEDRTNLSQGVTIERLAGSQRVAIGGVQKAATQSRGRSSFRLAPGEYELFDLSQPTNKAVLLVEP